MEKILLDVGIEASPPSKAETPSGTPAHRDASPAARALFSSSRPTTLSLTEPVQVNIPPKENVRVPPHQTGLT